MTHSEKEPLSEVFLAELLATSRRVGALLATLELLRFLVRRVPKEIWLEAREHMRHYCKVEFFELGETHDN